MSKPNTDPHATAAAALRVTIARAVEQLTTDLENKGRAGMRLKALRVEARCQVADAEAIRRWARETGWLA